MRPFLVFFTLFGLACSPAFASRAATDKVTMLMVQKLDAQGEPMPLNPVRTQLIARIGAEAGLKIEVQTYPWRRAQRMAELGMGLLWGVTRTPAREARFAFSEPVYFEPVWAVTPANSALHIRSLDDLRGKVVIIMGGARYGGEFEAARDKLFKVEEDASTPAARMSMLAHGRADLLVMSSLRTTSGSVADSLNCQYGNIGNWAVSDTPLTQEGVHIAAAQGSPMTAYLPRLNAALLKLQHRGEIKATLDSFTHTLPASCREKRPG